MKKILTLLMVLGMVTIANATVIDVVRDGVGDQGNAGTAGNPLVAGETIGIKIILNNNPFMYEGTHYPAYDGYFLSGVGFDLDVSDNASLEPAHKTSGPPFYTPYDEVSVVTGFVGKFTDPYIIDNTFYFEGISLEDIGPGELTMIWDLTVTASGAGAAKIDVDLIMPEDLANTLKYAEYEMFPPATVRTYDYLTQSDFGSLTDLYQVPEPMTIALLGLGGLGLMYRRRRA